ncbi:MAG: Flp family type IVb pilin [Alphaproteobacteria bacterium]|nr:Flp family type IVb pilin [Alphaproteobacteria bacterium]
MYTRRDLLFGRPPLVEEDGDLLSSESGAAAIEYGLIASLIAIVLAASMTRLGKRQRRNYNCVKRAMRGKEANKFCKKRGA